MRSKNAIILFVLLTFTCTNAFDFASFVELGELKNDPYGKSLIQTISMTMEKTGGKIEKIEGLIDELLAKLIQDMRKADFEWGREKKRLLKKISGLKNTIAKLENELAGLKKTRAHYRKLKSRSEKNLKQYKQQYTANVNSLNNLKLRRTKDRALYRTRVSQASAIIGALNRVMAALRKLRGNYKGIHKASHVKAASLAEISNDREVVAFLELATEVDFNALKRLISILKTIRHGEEVSLIVDERNEAKSKKTFKKLVLSLRADIVSLKASIKKQKANLKRYIKKLNELAVTIKIRTDLLKSRRSELKATVEEKRTKENKYIRDKAHRKKEEKVIRRVKKIVKERLAKMNSYLKSKVN